MISVVIATRNEEKNIRACIESAKAQAGADYEIIVVDNNSSDCTRALASAMEVKVYNIAEEVDLAGKTNLRGCQVNFGISKCTGDVVFFPDADMTFEPGLFAEAEELITKGYDALYIPEIVNGSGFLGMIRRFERSFYNGTCIDAVRFVRRCIYEKVGGFDEMNISFAPDDWDLTKMLKQAGAKTFITMKVKYHNESCLGLCDYLRKKCAYVPTFDDYIEKWGNSDPDIKRQFGFLYRFFVVFCEGSKWKRVLSHPFLFCSTVALRFLVGVTFLLKKVKG